MSLNGVRLMLSRIDRLHVYRLGYKCTLLLISSWFVVCNAMIRLQITACRVSFYGLVVLLIVNFGSLENECDELNIQIGSTSQTNNQRLKLRESNKLP